MSSYNESEIERFLDEALTPDRMGELEDALRDDEALHGRLTAAVGRRDAGVHSLGSIWRQHRLSCPSREQLGSYLLQVLEEDVQEYVEFHLSAIGCRYCLASIEDLRERHSEDAGSAESRRRKYFQSSAGYLSPDD